MLVTVSLSPFRLSKRLIVTNLLAPIVVMGLVLYQSLVVELVGALQATDDVRRVFVIDCDITLDLGSLLLGPSAMRSIHNMRPMAISYLVCC